MLAYTYCTPNSPFGVLILPTLALWCQYILKKNVIVLLCGSVLIFLKMFWLLLCSFGAAIYNASEWFYVSLKFSIQ